MGELCFDVNNKQSKMTISKDKERKMIHMGITGIAGVHLRRT